MRILLAHNNYRVYGGAEVFVHELARVLKSRGHEVAYLACNDVGVESEWQDYFTDPVDYASSPVSAALQAPRMFYSFRSRKAARRLIADFKPDIAHCFAIYTKLTPSILDEFRAHDVPVVCSFNDYKHICPNYKLFHHNHICEDCKGGRFSSAIRNRCAHDSLVRSVAVAAEAAVHHQLDIYRKNVNMFLFASRFMAHKTEEFWGASTFRWRLLRNSFNARDTQAVAAPGKFALYFGRVIEEKGVDLLVEAAAHAPGVDIVIVGDGADLEALQGVAARASLSNVTFVGAKWGDELDKYLADARFVVVPSKWNENLPYVVLQAFAHAKPVLGSHRGGITELVEDGERGMIFDPDDATSLPAKLEAMYDPERAMAMGRRAKAWVDEEFTDDKFYQQLMDVYSEVVA